MIPNIFLGFYIGIGIITFLVFQFLNTLASQKHSLLSSMLAAIFWPFAVFYLIFNKK